jgi:hypothetical protein
LLLKSSGTTDETVVVWSSTVRKLRHTLKKFRPLSAPAGFHPQRHAEFSVGTFFCDSGLGGLARWLRVAGYETYWQPNIEDAELLRQVERLKVILLTNDSLILERGPLRSGQLPFLFVPPMLPVSLQLEWVLEEFQLALRDSRCTRCGGELSQINKKGFANRIPPKTYRWLDEFWCCIRCNQVFWEGTHFKKIQEELQRLRQHGSAPNAT